jgi:CHAT domain-containing protein
MARPLKNKKTTNTQEQRKLRDLLEEMHREESQQKRAEDILKLIRSRQEKKLPKLEDTMTDQQLRRLKPLAWLIDNQRYTTAEILMVALINENRLKLKESDLEYERQKQQRD